MVLVCASCLLLQLKRIMKDPNRGGGRDEEKHLKLSLLWNALLKIGEHPQALPVTHACRTKWCYRWQFQGTQTLVPCFDIKFSTFSIFCGRPNPQLIHYLDHWTVLKVLHPFLFEKICCVTAVPAEHVLAYITSAYDDAHLISPELFRSYSTGTAALQPGSWDVPQQQTEALTP